MPVVKYRVRENQYNHKTVLASVKKTLMLMFLVCTNLVHLVDAQPEAPRTAIAPKPVGSGARALGQSAFIAVADDATAASWNPAGLINLEKPEASFVGAWKYTAFDYSASDTVATDRATWDNREINFMSYAQPIRIGKTDAVLSFNYHQVYDFGQKIEFLVQHDTNPLLIEARAEGAVSAYSLAGGLSLPGYPQITIGASFSWYTKSLSSDNAWQIKERRYAYKPGTTEFVLAQTEIDTFDDFRGHNFTFGLLLDAYERQEKLLTLGFVCHTPFTATLNREVDVVTPGFGSDPFRADWEMDFPLSLGMGANYRFSDSCSAAFDVEWKDWSKFKQRGPVAVGRPPHSSPIGGGDGDVADTLAFRLGGEHLRFVEGSGESVWAYRGGIFYEPRPALDEAMPVYGCSLGFGWTVRERFSLDFAYQFRWGEEVSGRNLGEDQRASIDYSIVEHFFVCSLITYFDPG